jgi:hypothetical protein
MINKLSNKTLLLIFAVLLAVVVIYMIYDSSHGERSFRSELVSIDTAKVTSINIYPKATNHKKVNLYKEGNYWNVKLANGQNASVPQSKIKQLLSGLLRLQPIGVAAQNKDKWKEFQVDSSGTEVEVYQGSSKTADITLGKFTYHRPNNMMTYVRVGGDDNVYEVLGFVNFEFNHDASYFRDGHVIKDNNKNWSKLSFAYPGDSSFVLSKVKNEWQLNGNKVDSATVAGYLNSISNITDQNFIDNPPQSILSKAKYTLTIQSSSVGGITVTAFANDSSLVITSSQYPDTYFNGKKNNFWNRIFVGKSKFYKIKKTGRRKV